MSCLPRGGWILFLAACLAVAGCRAGDSPDTEEPEPPAPVLQADPPAGTYDSFVLDVEISALDPEVELLFGVNLDPDLDLPWYQGAVSVHLRNSATIRVLARDPDGREWGPYSFAYQLRQRDAQGGCWIQEMDRIYYGPQDHVPVPVGYTFPTALSRLELLVDGSPEAYYAAEDIPRGVTTVTLPPFPVEKGYDVQCRISVSDEEKIEGDVVRLYMDATPPTAEWVNAAPWLPPTHYRLVAQDTGGSGVSHADICDNTGSYCLPMSGAGTMFSFSTSFMTGGADGFGVEVRVYDRAGNLFVMEAPLVDGSDIPTGASAYLHSVTMVTTSAFDLHQWLLDQGEDPPVEVRTIDDVPVDGHSLSLKKGWNEYLFRRAGEVSWQTFGTYHAGVDLTLPSRDPALEGAWLVYASQSTVPVLQATRIAVEPLASSDWLRPWFDIPRLFVVEDVDNTGVWDDDDRVFVLDALDEGGPWLRRAEPLRASLVEVVSQPGTQARSVLLECEDCYSGGVLTAGVLRLQRRSHSEGPPVGRYSWSAGEVSEFPVTVEFQADAEDTCLFFWDEDVNGVVNGDEPRQMLPCDSAEALLGRAEALTVETKDDSFFVRGIPYGGAITALVEVLHDSGEALFTRPLPLVMDRDGTGHRQVEVTDYGRWPLRLSTWDDQGSRKEASLPGSPLSTTTTVEVDVRDESDSLIAAVVENQMPGLSDYQIFDGSVRALVGVNPDDWPYMRAHRDGYVSEWYQGDGSLITLRLYSPAAAGLVQGHVYGADGEPVLHALISWDAGQWTSQTFTDSQGWYSLPILGTGLLSARLPDSIHSEDAPLVAAAGDTFSHTFHLPPTVPVWPMGMVTTQRVTAVTGPSPASVSSNDLYTWAWMDGGTGLPAGQWVMHAAENLRRPFLVPGAMPGYELHNPSPLSVPWTSLLLASSMHLRCGAREQVVSFGIAPLVDSLCWEWYAAWGGQAFYLGRPSPVGGMPNAGLKEWRATIRQGGVVVPSLDVQLRDLIFDRKVEATTDGAGRLHVALPHGFYEVRTASGQVLNTGHGEPAFVPVSHIAPSTMTLHLP